MSDTNICPGSDVRYNGDWEDDQRTGFGFYEWPQFNMTYEGGVFHGFRHGAGTLTIRKPKHETMMIRGNSVLGVMEGKCKITHMKYDETYSVSKGHITAGKRSGTWETINVNTHLNELNRYNNGVSSTNREGEMQMTQRSILQGRSNPGYSALASTTVTEIKSRQVRTEARAVSELVIVNTEQTSGDDGGSSTQDTPSAKAADRYGGDNMADAFMPIEEETKPNFNGIQPVAVSTPSQTGRKWKPGSVVCSTLEGVMMEDVDASKVFKWSRNTEESSSKLVALMPKRCATGVKSPLIAGLRTPRSLQLPQTIPSQGAIGGREIPLMQNGGSMALILGPERGKKFQLIRKQVVIGRLSSRSTVDLIGGNSNTATFNNDDVFVEVKQMGRLRRCIISWPFDDDFIVIPREKQLQDGSLGLGNGELIRTRNEETRSFHIVGLEKGDPQCLSLSSTEISFSVGSRRRPLTGSPTQIITENNEPPKPSVQQRSVKNNIRQSPSRKTPLQSTQSDFLVTTELLVTPEVKSSTGINTRKNQQRPVVYGSGAHETNTSRMSRTLTSDNSTFNMREVCFDDSARSVYNRVNAFIEVLKLSKLSVHPSPDRGLRIVSPVMEGDLVFPETQQPDSMELGIYGKHFQYQEKLLASPLFRGALRLTDGTMLFGSWAGAEGCDIESATPTKMMKQGWFARWTPYDIGTAQSVSIQGGITFELFKDNNIISGQTESMNEGNKFGNQSVVVAKSTRTARGVGTVHTSLGNRTNTGGGKRMSKNMTADVGSISVTGSHFFKTTSRSKSGSTLFVDGEDPSSEGNGAANNFEAEPDNGPGTKKDTTDILKEYDLLPANNIQTKSKKKIKGINLKGLPEKHNASNQTASSLMPQVLMSNCVREAIRNICETSKQYSDVRASILTLLNRQLPLITIIYYCAVVDIKFWDFGEEYGRIIDNNKTTNQPKVVADITWDTNEEKSIPLLVADSFCSAKQSCQQLNVPSIGASACWISSILAHICQTCDIEIEKTETAEAKNILDEEDLATTTQAKGLSMLDTLEDRACTANKEKKNLLANKTPARSWSEMRNDINTNIQRYNRMFIPRRIRSKYNSDLPLLQTVASSSTCVQLAAFVATIIYSCSLIGNKDFFDPEYSLSLILSKMIPFASFACFGDPLYSPENTTQKGRQRVSIMDLYNHLLCEHNPPTLCALMLANLVKPKEY